MKRPWLATTAALAFTLGGVVRADPQSALDLTVLDAAGRPLRGVGVVVSAPSEGQRWSGSTDARGLLTLTGLPPGTPLSVECSSPGFATTRIPDVVLGSSSRTRLEVRLPGENALREEVRVRETGRVVGLDEQGSSVRLDAETLSALPILGRNYQEVLALAPGVTDVDRDGNPNIHGARDTDVATFMDGVNTTDPLTGKIGMQMNIEAIQEIEVKTSGASAEFGRAQGGFTNILTKSGGNRLEAAFKLYWRGSFLDGDGAGQDDPALHGGVGETALGDLSFDDLLPFVSVSGPIARDRAWFYVSLEAIRIEEPVNAVNQAFVSTTKEQRAFAKATWQPGRNHRVSLVLNTDPVERLNSGVNSLTREETGYTVSSGGPMLTGRWNAVLSPTVVFETTLSYMVGRPGLTPNLGPDTNRDGRLSVDRDGDGFLSAKERDPGEDLDGDGAFDVWEDTLKHNGLLDQREIVFCPDENGVVGPHPPVKCAAGPALFLIDEDGFRPPWVGNEWYFPPGDGDRRLTPPGGCEGDLREDHDCDGHLDVINEDVNGNGRLDPGEDEDHDFQLDLGGEDRNGNGRLDDTPFPASDFPYGHRSPRPGDRDYEINLRSGIVSGPYHERFEDERARGTFRQDLSVFVPDFKGSHDLKMGFAVEREQFDRDSSEHPVVARNDPGYRTGILLDQVRHPELQYDCNPYYSPCRDPGVGRLTAILPLSLQTSEEASGRNLGIYAQDTWKPIPSISLGLGVRLDREAIASRGWTYFDPAWEGTLSARLLALAGSESGKVDLIEGNGDGVESAGILADPMLSAAFEGDGPARQILDGLRSRALRLLTHPATDVAFDPGRLGQLFPEVIVDGHVDLEALRAQGARLQEPEAFTIDNTNLSPRISVSWDPGADGRSKLFGTWGRYYDRLFLSSVTGEQGLQSVQRYYVLDRDGLDTSGGLQYGDPLVATTNHGFGSRLSSAPPSVTQVSRNLRTPYADEWTVGFEREVAPETALALRYVHRQYRDQLQDIDVNHSLRTDPATGQAADVLGVLMEVRTAPFQPPTRTRVRDGRPDLFVRNPFFNQVLRVGNFNHALYRGVELELRRRLARRWQMQASYTYSRAMGEAEDFQSRLGNDPSSVESEFGYLDYDQRHVVKVSGSVYLPREWQLGLATTWASGLPYSVVSRFFAHDNADYVQFRTRYGSTTLEDGVLAFQDLGRNSERNQATLNLDFSLQRHFVIGRTVWSGLFEVFNALNTDDLHVVSVEPSRTEGLDAESLKLLNSPSQLDATRRFGRRFQIGFQVQF